MPEIAVSSCGRCGFRNDDAARYCGGCGVSLRERCAQCGGAVRAAQSYCSNCGLALAPARSPFPGAEIPEGLRRRIEPAEAERKTATLLVADTVNSTGIVAELDAEDAKQFRLSTLRIMADAVHRYDGIVIAYRGDQIVASFGAPVALEDHAVRACYAALDMQKAIRARAADVAREFGLPLEVRIGINSGQVVVTVKYEGGELRTVDVDGTPINVAARLETLARPGTVLLSHDTLSLAEGYVRTSALGAHALKSIREPLELHELEGINARNRIRAYAARGLSKFVGREYEIESLGRLAAQALDGRGQIAAVVGEAGVGKSRVFLEFLHSAAMREWLVLETASVWYGRATSYLPLVDLISRYFELDPADTEDRVRDRIVGKLAALGEERLLAQTPFLLGALGMGLDHDDWKSLAPAERQRAMFGALKQLLIRESRRQPLCLVFEDLHWVDAETQAFLVALSQSIPAARVLLLVNFRPDYHCPWAGTSFCSQIRIEPLPAQSADVLLDALLGNNAGLASLRQSLLAVTEGNPLFLEECVRSLLDGGVLEGPPGERRVRGLLPANFVPPTVEALLAARMDRLSPELKELLQCAAVIGTDVPRALLAAVGELPEPEVDRCVAELQAGEFLFETSLFPETVYTFRHSMTREVAYQGLVRERRTALHARAARALEALAAGHLDEHVDRLGEHTERGGLWEKALDYLQRAGAKAYDLYANAQAAHFFERALGALRHLPPGPTTLERAVDLRFELRNALLGLGETDRILRCLREVEPLLDALGDRLRRARYAAFRCNHHFLAAEHTAALDAGNTGLALAEECGDLALKGELLYRVGQSYYVLGRSREAVARLTESLQCTPHERERLGLVVMPAVVNRTWLVYALAERGDFSEGITHAKRALEIARVADHQPSEVLAWLATGHLLLRKGEFEGAVGALEFGLDLCEKWAASLRVWRPRLASSLGVASARNGDPARGLELARRALAEVDQMQLAVDRPLMLVRLGQASLIAGRVTDAKHLADQALAIASAHEARVDEGWARFLIARAAHAADPDDADGIARRELDAALRVAGACDARPLAAFCQTALGAVHARRGDRARAGECFAAADAAYKALDMRSLPLDPSGR
ncbi:MAG: AAA family ATPase [Burkholderiales bacterium]|nr:AAA family ATPase [Burkholderiales bacterium]